MSERNELPTTPPIAAKPSVATSEPGPRVAPWAYLGRAVGWLRQVRLTPDRQAWLVLCVILVLLGYYKFLFTSATFTSSVDGGYYTDVAKHVRDGYGLSTSISLRHKGYSHFPHPTAVYPLWPLLYGYLARVFPLFEAGKWANTAFYFIILVFGYLWAKRLFPRPLLSEKLGWLNAGHVFVLLFGINRNIHLMTSMPFTEGLAFALLMVALWRLVPIVSKPRFLGGFELGVWAALVMLTRPPLVMLLMAALPCLLFSIVVVRGQRFAYAKLLLGCLVGFVLALVPRYLQLASFVPDFRLAHILRFDDIYYNHILSRHDALLQSDTLKEKLERTIEGFKVAFAWGGRYPYSKQYYTAQYALPLVLPFLLSQGFRAAWYRRWTAAISWLRTRDNQHWVLLFVFALGAFFSLHLLHRYHGWYFQRRHTLPAFFLIFLALIHLFRSGRVGKLVGLVVFCSSLWIGGDWFHTRTLATYDKMERNERGDSPSLVKWLKAERRKRDREPLIIAMRQPGKIAWKTDGIGYHHYDTRTTLSDIRKLVTELGVDYVLVPRRERIRFARSSTFKRLFDYRATRSGQRIYVPKRRLFEQGARQRRAPSDG